MLAERIEEWTRPWLEEGREQGIEEGRAQGRELGREQGLAEERSLLCRQAARKLGGATAGWLPGLLDGLTAPGPLAEVGDWIIGCDTGEDLFDRTSRLLRRSCSFAAGAPTVQAAGRTRAPPPPMFTLEYMREMLADGAKEWRRVCVEKGREQGFAEGRKQGIEQGIEEGRAEQRSLLCRQAARKFDGETAGRLSGLLDGLAAPGPLAEVGEWIIDCDTGEDLLDRTSRMLRRASSFTAGGGVEGPNVRASAGETAPPPSARPLEGRGRRRRNGGSNKSISGSTSAFSTASRGASSRGWPSRGACFAVRRGASSTARRPGDCRVFWTISRLPNRSSKSVSGSSTAIPARTCSTARLG